MADFGLDDATKAIQLFSAAVDAIRAIIGAVSDKEDGDTAAALAQLTKLQTAITSIGAVVAALPAGLAELNKADLDKALADLDRLRTSIGANRTTSDEALDKKFDPGDNNG